MMQALIFAEWNSHHDSNLLYLLFNSDFLIDIR